MEINPGHVLWSAPEAERAGRPTLILLHGHRMDERVGFELRHHLPAELVFASVRAPREARGGGYAWFPMGASFSLEAIDHSAAAVLTGWTRWTSMDRSGSSASPRVRPLRSR